MSHLIDALDHLHLMIHFTLGLGIKSRLVLILSLLQPLEYYIDTSIRIVKIFYRISNINSIKRAVFGEIIISKIL